MLKAMLSRGKSSTSTGTGSRSSVGIGGVTEFDAELKRLRQRMSSLPTGSGSNQSTAPALPTTSSLPAYMQGSFQPVSLRTEKPRSTNPNSGVHDELETLRYLKRTKLEFEASTQPIDDFSYDEELERIATKKSEPLHNDPFLFLPNTDTQSSNYYSVHVTQGEEKREEQLLRQRIQDDMKWSNQLEDKEASERTRLVTARSSNSTALTIKKASVGTGGLTPTKPTGRTSTASPVSSLSTRVGTSDGVQEGRRATSRGKEFKYARGVETKGLYDVDLKKPLSTGKPVPIDVSPPPKPKSLHTETSTPVKQQQARPSSTASRANSSVVHIKYRRACEYEAVDEGRMRFCHECHRVVLGGGVGNCPHCGSLSRDDSNVTDSTTTGAGDGTLVLTGDALLIAEIEERERKAFQDAIQEWRGGKSPKKGNSMAVGGDEDEVVGGGQNLTTIRPPMKAVYFMHLWEQMPFKTS